MRKFKIAFQVKNIGFFREFEFTDKPEVPEIIKLCRKLSEEEFEGAEVLFLAIEEITDFEINEADFKLTDDLKEILSKPLSDHNPKLGKPVGNLYGEITRNTLARWFKYAKQWFLDDKIYNNCVALLPQNGNDKGLIVFCNKQVSEESFKKIHDIIFKDES